MGNAAPLVLLWLSLSLRWGEAQAGGATELTGDPRGRPRSSSIKWTS